MIRVSSTGAAGPRGLGTASTEPTARTHDGYVLHRGPSAARRARRGRAVMRTLHLGLRVAEMGRSIAFYTAIGYEVLGEVPVTELGTLTMLKLPGDEFVTLELVYDRDHGPVE